MEDEKPQELSSLNRKVFDDLQKLSDNELWERIRPCVVSSYNEKLANEKNRQLKKSQAKFFSSEFSGEKLLPKRESTEVNVKHGLVVDHLKAFLEKGDPSAILYNTQKIDLAYEFNELLKRIYEVKTSSNTHSIYTAVGQLFMHTASTDGVEKWILLPGPVDNEELIECLRTLQIEILWFAIKDGICEFKFNQ